jgi:hypothetical protein
MEPQELLNGMNFGRVDAETDSRFDSCFIGTEMLRHVLQPQHSLVLGSKGSGKSAAFRLLCQDRNRVESLLPKNYEELFFIPVYGLQTDDDLPGLEFQDLHFSSIDDFRNFWLLYIGLKSAATLTHSKRMEEIVNQSKSKELKNGYKTIKNVIRDLGISREPGSFAKFKFKIKNFVRPRVNAQVLESEAFNRLLSIDFPHRTGMSVKALLDTIDMVLEESNCVAWVLLDKLDLIFIDDFARLKSAITALVQILVEHGNRFKNTQFKIFLRNDIYRQLRIVNKSHLVSYTQEMKWKEHLLMKLLVSRAVADDNVREYVSGVLGEEIEVAHVIQGDEALVQKVFYSIFEPSLNGNGNGNGNGSGSVPEPVPFTHIWVLKHLTDGMGHVYPRELIHLGNIAVEKQREINREEGKHASTRLISSAALREAFADVSVYRCDTYLYSEFPHLAKHFDLFRGSDKATFHRSELYKLFEALDPTGDEAIRSIYDAGLITPMGRTVDSSMEFKVPLLYRTGLGITQRGSKLRSNGKGQKSVVEEESTYEDIII